MGAPHVNCTKRRAAAVVASGVVISLTTLTAGLAPAVAKPADPVVPPTPTLVAPAEPPAVAEEPAREAPPREAPVREVPPVAADIPVAPTAPPAPVAPPVEQAAPPAVEAPSVVPEPAPQPKVVAPAPKLAPVAPPAAPSSAAVPAPSVVPPSIAQAPPAASSEKPAPPAPSATPEPKPAEQGPPSPESAVPAPAADPAPVLPGLVAPIAEPAPPSPAGIASPAPAAQPDAVADELQGASRPGEGERSAVRATPSTPVAEAAQAAIKTEAPKTLQAPKEDVQAALSAKVVEEKPLPAAKEDVDAFASVVKSTGSNRDDRDGNGPRDKDGPFAIGNRNDNRHDDRDRDRYDGDRRVRQWDPRWVAYDDYYRPVICNPYRHPVRIVYIYQNTPRIVIINPLARVVLDVAQYAAYSFTAVVANAANQAVNVAVGSFFGGGYYYPGYGAPLPPPPPPLLRYDNVPVQVRYPQATYEPFRVQRIVDVGDDAQYGERKVLLDGVTPAWGEWTQTPTGERQFEVHKTQQYPGLDEPREGPLPGDYQLRLASDEGSGMDAKSIYLGVVAGALAVLSLGAVAWSVMLGRRRSRG